MKKLRLPNSFYNYTSFAGSIIAIISLFMIAFLIVVSTVFEEGGSYLGLFIFIVLPVFLVMGLLLIPIGMHFRHRKNKRLEIVAKKNWPKVDLNDKRTRNGVLIFGVGSVFLLLISAMGTYEAFHYSESVEFCGTICHTVMKPEYVAYHNSSHARVSCVECHVGSGANWYVRSKLSGLYQVYAVTMGVYPKPIPTPIRNLRPAQETCENCHWPQKFYSPKLVLNRHYLPDESNTEWDVYLQMKTSPAHSAMGLEEGIHWHINPNVRVEYIATDSVRTEIPWVKYSNLETGEERIFYDSTNRLTDEEVANHEKRTMDCMDCHNRPSHDYQTPINFINNAITAGEISKDLPDIKYLAMEILGNEFPTTDSAMDYIDQEVRSYYGFMYEELVAEKPELIDQAVAGIQKQFSLNVFPEMAVRWDVYQNHIGHLEFDGCFRCHNDRHSTSDGRKISMDCNLCHTIIAQGVPDTMSLGSIFNPLEFVHPNDPNEGWKDDLCSECHKDLYEQ